MAHSEQDGPNVRVFSARSAPTTQARRRFGGALTASIAAHGAAFLIVGFILSRSTVSHQSIETRPAVPSHIIWIAQAGLGGGGSGKQMTKPSQALRRPGHDAIAVPTVKARASDAKKDVEKPERPLDIPAMPTTAGLQDQVGVVTPLTVISSASSQGPGKGGQSGDGIGAGSGPGVGDGLGPGRNRGAGNGGQGGNGASAPRLIREVKPGYTANAMRARIQGVVRVQAIVQPDGSVGETHVVRSLDSTFGLDDEATRTVKQWRFAPATLQGRAVAALVEVELTFTLR